MKRFACGDVVPGCDASWTGGTDDDVFAAVSVHAGEVHGLTELTPELSAAVRSAIVTLA
jgi:predicted small metal-binding protein